ncbi:MAG: hypothetical protein HC854_13365 [Flavobacterium sp.]|nr:hypothetical protein [Flavobacterium sp.]
MVSAKNDVKYKCDIPDEVRSYIESNKEFEFLKDKDLNLIIDYLEPTSCPTYTKGDFNNNGKEDIAVIVRYTGYKSQENGSYTYPFLIVFNDFKDGIKPNIIYKTGDYKDEIVKTVIYDQYDEGIISYIKKGKVCEKEVIDIILPEKSSFFVYWNLKKSKYEFLNYLDDSLCEKINNEVKTMSILNNWQNDFIEIQITTDNISYLFNGQCVYAFPVKIINDNEVELIWGELGMDCVNDMQFNKTFGLTKEQIPQKGKPFAKYKLENEIVNVTYYYEEWIEIYKEQVNIKPFLDTFYIKE